MLLNKNNQVIQLHQNKNKIFSTTILENQAVLNRIEDISEEIEYNLAIHESKNCKIHELEKELKRLKDKNYKRKFRNLVKDQAEEKKKLKATIDEIEFVISKQNEHIKKLNLKCGLQISEIDSIKRNYVNYQKSAAEDLDLMLKIEQDNVKNITSNFNKNIKRKDSKIADLKLKLNEKSKEFLRASKVSDEKDSIFKVLKAEYDNLKKQEKELKDKISNQLKPTDLTAIENSKEDNSKLAAENLNLKRDLDEKTLACNHAKIQKSRIEEIKNRQISEYEMKFEGSKTGNRNKRNAFIDKTANILDHIFISIGFLVLINVFLYLYGGNELCYSYHALVIKIVYKFLDIWHIVTVPSIVGLYCIF